MPVINGLHLFDPFLNWRGDEEAMFKDNLSDLLIVVAGNPHTLRRLPVGRIPPTMFANYHLAVIET
jgi:hypothetical protein